MPVYGIILNNVVANVINADDVSVAMPIAKTVSTNAFVVEITEGSSEGIGWVWNGEKLVLPAQETLPSENVNNANI